MIILLNGPPRSGKDTFYKFAKQWIDVKEYKMSRPLKQGLISIFDIPSDMLGPLEEYKDQPTEMFFGKSYRQAQIDLFRWLETEWGDDVLTRIGIKRVQALMSKHIIVDVGRQIEAEELMKGLGYGNTALVTLSRPDCTFEGDSREHISNSSFKFSRHIDNSFDLMLYEQQVKRCLIDLEVIQDA